MSTYPVPLAGQRLTAAFLTSMLSTEVLKAANTDRANNTMTDDPELTATLVANATYFVEFFILAGGGTTGDIRTLWTVPSGATGLKAVMGPGSTAADANADNITGRQGVHGYATVIAYSGVRNSAGNLFQFYERATITTGVSGGTLALNWAQVTTDAVTAARVGAGSMLRYKRIA